MLYTISFFYNATATTEIYTLSLHDALPICLRQPQRLAGPEHEPVHADRLQQRRQVRSEEHTSELQSLRHLVCRLLLEKKKKKCKITILLKHETTIPYINIQNRTLP